MKKAATLWLIVWLLSGCSVSRLFATPPCVHTTSWTGSVDENFRLRVEDSLRGALQQQCRLRVELNSPGGDVFNMLEIIRQMELAKSQGLVIEIHARMIAASAAALILYHGTAQHRWVAPGTYILVHATRTGFQCYDSTNLPTVGDKQTLWTFFGPVEVEVDAETAAIIKHVVTGVDRAAAGLTVPIRCAAPVAGGADLAVEIGLADSVRD